jgi:predicted RNase H-like HicB family nuclease
MHTYTAVVERCAETGLYVGYIPGFRGAHTQAETLDELDQNLREVLELLLEDGEPRLQAEFVAVDQQNEDRHAHREPAAVFSAPTYSSRSFSSGTFFSSAADC